MSIYEGLRPLKLLGSLLEVVRVFFRKDGKKIEWKPNQSHTYTGDMTYEFPAPDSAANSSDILVSEQSAQTLTNKAMNFASGGNVATDLPLSSLKADEDARNKVILRNSTGVPVNALIGQQHLDGALTDVISGKVNVSALTTETTARTAADSALSTRVDTLEEGGGVDISSKADVSALASEIAARIAADTALGTRIDTEASARAAADWALITRFSVLEFGSAVWYPADGATKTIIHPYNSINLEVHILDVDNERIYIDSVKSPASNTLVLRASVAPPASTYWTVFYRKLQ